MKETTEMVNNTINGQHQCDRQGIPLCWGSTYHKDSPIGEIVISDAAYECFKKVLEIDSALGKELAEYAVSNMAPDKASEYRRRHGQITDMRLFSFYFTLIRLTSLLTSNFPANLDTPQNMARDMMVNAGFCCQEAVDRWMIDAFRHLSGEGELRAAYQRLAPLGQPIRPWGVELREKET
jgi:hypothetical protein